jgi:hypothetical protein
MTFVQGTPADRQLLKKKASKDDVPYDENEIGTVLEQALSVMPKDINDYDVSTSGTRRSDGKPMTFR